MRHATGRGRAVTGEWTGACRGCGRPLPAGSHRNRRWCSERCRKASYGDPCVHCGARTGFGAQTARKPRPVCRDCQTVWTRERILRAIRDWHALFGEPPRAQNWMPVPSRGAWPPTTAVLNRFGRWNNAIRDAGFTPRKPGAQPRAANHQGTGGAR